MAKPGYIIRVNWGSVLFISFFLAYGFYGAITPGFSQFKENIALSVTLLLLLTAILVSFGVLARQAPDEYQDSIYIRRADVLVLILLVAVLFPVSYGQLQFSLYSDEISYSATSHGHGMHLSMVLVQMANIFDDIPFRYVVQAISVVLLLLLICLYFIIKRFSWRNRIIIIAILFVVGRLAITFMGGNGSPHPPLQLLPPFVFGSLFGVTAFSFKFSYFFAYLVFIFILYRMVHRILSLPQSFLVALAIGTIPLLLHMGSVVEHALWASICFILVVAEILTAERLNYVRVVSFVSIMTLMRQPSFIAILPIMILFYFNTASTQNWRGQIPKLAYALLPVLLFVPFLGRSLIYGTPSTDGLEHGASYLRAIDAIQSGVIWTSINDSVPYWWVVFIPLAFIPIFWRMAGKNLSLIIFFAASVYVYYSIDPSLWGEAKYQAEYAIPFACAGLLILATRLPMPGLIGVTVTLFTAVAIVLNIVNYRNGPKEIQSTGFLGDSKSILSNFVLSGRKFLVARPYDYLSAYTAIRNEKLQDHVYSIGPTYGIFPEIMNGFSVRSIKSVHDIYMQQQKNSAAVQMSASYVDSIEGDRRIRAVLVGAVNHKTQLIEEFKRRGWTIIGSYNYQDYETSVVALRR